VGDGNISLTEYRAQLRELVRRLETDALQRATVVTAVARLVSGIERELTDRRLKVDWGRIEADIREGATPNFVARKYDLSITYVRARAKREGWMLAPMYEGVPDFVRAADAKGPKT